MAALADAERFNVWADWMQKNTATCSITKTDLRAAVNAADDWAELNASSYNLALPLAARNNLTAKQKARILAYVITRRFELS